MRRIRFLVCGFLLPLAAFGASGVPQQISYQGKITGPAGVWSDTAVAMTFALYDDSSAAGYMWTETQKEVAIKNGLFSVQLGAVEPIPSPVFSGAVRWLGVSIESGPEVTPRTRIVSQPHAYHAWHADSAYTISNNAITSAKIADGAIQFPDLGQNGATTGKIIKWNGSTWALANDSIGTGGGAGGWTDGGSVVRLSSAGDSVGVGINTPTAKLHVAGDVKVTSGDLLLPYTSDVQFGSDTTRIQGTLNDLYLRAKEDIGIHPADKTYFGGSDMTSWVCFDNATFRAGFGTLSPEDKLHVDNGNISGTSFLRLESSHATSFGEAGLRIKTPENTWHLRVDDYTHNNLPNAGSLALRSGDLGSEVMTWLEDGKVGVGTTSPNQKLHVYGNARVKDTLFAGAFGSNVLKATNLIDEPGISSSFNDLTPHADTVWDTVISQSIDVPAAGYVLAFATMGLWTMPFSENPIEGSLAISKYPNSLGTSADWHYHFSDYDQTTSPTTLHEIFTVSSSGHFRYYLLSKTETPSNVTLFWNSKITLIYIPSLYGSILTAAQAEDGPFHPVDASQRTTDQQFKKEHQVGKADFESLVQEVALLRRAVDSLKGR